MSNQDEHFFNVFSGVIGLLVAIAVGIFILSRIVGSHIETAHVESDPLLQKKVEDRIRPFGQVAVAGQDNAALAMTPAAGAGAAAQPAATAASLPANGEETFKAVCSACHGMGIGGAPKFGDKAAWAPRIAKGIDTLHQHALQGFQGSSGMMPPKGGRPDLTDKLVKEAVDYMVAHSR